MTWQQLENAGRVRPHQTSKQELDDLRAVIKRDLDDAGIQQLSDDRRFATAYNAALQTAAIVVSCAGYRTTGPSHHATTFEAIELVLGASASSYSLFFDACRRKRNMVDYDMSGVATTTEVEQLIHEVKSFLIVVEGWISQSYPLFAQTP